MPEVIIDNSRLTMVYHSDHRIIHHTLHQSVAGKPLRDMLVTGVDVMRETGATKWLSDDRKNEHIDPGDAEWFALEWGPSAANAGWKHWALVVPESLAGKMDMTGVVETFYRLGVHVVVFTDLDRAMDWLIEQ